MVGCQFTQQEGVDGIVEILACGSFRLQPKLLGDGAQNLGIGQAGVQHQRGFGLVIQCVEQGATQRCLAGTDFAGDHHEPLALADPVLEQVEGNPMIMAEIQERRVGRHVERVLLKSEKIFVHRLAFVRYWLPWSLSLGDSRLSYHHQPVRSS